MIERFINLLWCLIGLGTMVNSWTLGLIGPSGPQSGLFPMICGGVITACGMALLLGQRASRVADPEWPRGAALARIVGVSAGLVAMATALPYLGFAIASGITTFVLLQTVERSRVIESLLLSVVSVAAVMFVFGRLLGMSLPRGPWGW